MSDSSTDPVRVGAILRDTYEILALIGEGGMGSVFSARHVRLPKQVAIKVLKGDFSANPEVVSRFRREAEIASRLGHPNIVEVLDFDTLPNGSPFLVLEFLKGESLASRLSRGPMRWEETRSIAIQIGSALAVAHKAGVVHRDLKPDNIFLLPGDSTGAAAYRVKLLDFGISKLAQENATRQTQDAVLMGTPQYMSPEQGLGKNSLTDARSDVFALGCIFYEMLSGRPAFSGENVPQIIFRIVYQAPTPLPEWVPGLPENVWPAIERALAKNPDDRFPDVVSLTEALTGTRLQELQELMPASRPYASAPRGGTVQLEAAFLAPPSTPAIAPVPSHASGPLLAVAALVPSATPAPVVALRVKPPFPIIPSVVVVFVVLGLGVAVLVALRRDAQQRELHAAPFESAWVQPPAEVPEPSAPVAVASPLERTRHAQKLAKRGLDEEAAFTSLEPTYATAAGDLLLVKAALEVGDANLALERAARMQRKQLSSHGYGLITQAYCRLHDLSNAQAAFRNVTGIYRAPTAAACHNQGIPVRAR